MVLNAAAPPDGPEGRRPGVAATAATDVAASESIDEPPQPPPPPPLRPSSPDGNADEAASGAAPATPFLLAGTVRALAFTLKKGAIKGAMKASVRRRAFAAIGSRTAGAGGGGRTQQPTPKPAKAIPAAVTVSSGVGAGGAADAARRKILIKVSAVGGTLLKNMIYGVSVFGTYEFIIYQNFFGSLSGRGDGKEASSSIPTDLHSIAPRRGGGSAADPSCCEYTTRTSVGGEKVHHMTTPTTPVISHFAAGACAGIVQSALMCVVEFVNPPIQRWAMGIVAAEYHDRRPGYGHNFLLRRAVHHSLGYASLFGCFELVRSNLLAHFHNSLLIGTSYIPFLFDELEHRGLYRGKHEDDLYDVTPVTLAAAFLAGGFAGQFHYVVSHYTSHWKLLAVEDRLNSEKAAELSAPTKHRFFPQNAWKQMPKPPPLLAILSSFAPTAIAFVAFQYGGMLTERAMGLSN